MQIILAAMQPDLAAAWERQCADLDGVSIHRGSLFDVPADAAVAPMDNAFGFLTSGISYQFLTHFGPETQARLQDQIAARHHGELLVGAAEIVSTGRPRLPWLIAAPVARVPGLLSGTVNAYLATRAALLLIRHGFLLGGALEARPVHTVVTRVVLPGMATGGARLAVDQCAQQMRAAILDTIVERARPAATLDEARARHRHLAGDGHSAPA